MCSVLHYMWGEMAAWRVLPLCNTMQALMSSPDKDDQLFPLQQSSCFWSNSLQVSWKTKKPLIVWTKTKVEDNCALLMEVIEKTERETLH